MIKCSHATGGFFTCQTCVEQLESDNADLRAELAALKPKWAKEVPKVAGWYWIRDSDGVIQTVELWEYNGYLCLTFQGDEVPAAKMPSLEFAGPLPEPEE